MKLKEPCVDVLIRADIGVDTMLGSYFDSSHHMDNKKIKEALNYIGAEWHNSIDGPLVGWPYGLNLTDCEKTVYSILRPLGRLLHTLQDAYSHSEWIEKNGGNDPTTGRIGEASPESIPLWHMFGAGWFLSPGDHVEAKPAWWGPADVFGAPSIDPQPGTVDEQYQSWIPRSCFVNRTCTFSPIMASAVHDPDHG